MPNTTTYKVNPSNYKPTRCAGSSNYPAANGKTATHGTCSACKQTVKLTKTGLVKAHD